MNKVYRLGYSAATAFSALALSAGSAFAQIGTSSLSIDSSIGDINNINQGFIWVINLLRYLGWAGVILGVGMAIFGLVYKLINTDSEEAMKTVQGYLTKAVLIVVAGILLISAGFIVEQVGNLFGEDDAVFEIPTQLQGS